MKEQYERTRLLFGESAMKKLAASRVAIFGIGGVGGYVMEALARSGIGTLDLIDADRVDETAACDAHPSRMTGRVVIDWFRLDRAHS